MPTCCSSANACAIGGFESILQTMKESHDKPHFNGPLNNSTPQKPSKLGDINGRYNLFIKTLSEHQLSLKKTNTNFESNKQPFIPMCKTFGKWGSLSQNFYKYTAIAWCESFQPGNF